MKKVGVGWQLWLTKIPRTTILLALATYLGELQNQLPLALR